jgi:hypothetical protein
MIRNISFSDQNLVIVIIPNDGGEDDAAVGFFVAAEQRNLQLLFKMNIYF